MVGSSGGNGKQPESVSILRAEMTRFPDIKGGVRKREGGEVR